MRPRAVAADQTPDGPSELGPRLRAIRIERGVGLRELARRLDLSPSLISQIETGKIRPSVRTLYALASEFGVTTDELLFDQALPTEHAARPSVADSSSAVAEPGLTVLRGDERSA